MYIPFRSNVVSGIKDELSGPGKGIQFDTSPEQEYNIHLANGVFEYKTKTFRPRNKYDYVTMKLSWNYDPSIITDEAREVVREIFRKILPDEEKRDMLLSYLSMSLTGNTKEKKFIMMVGEGSNGKSAIFKMMESVFEFYVKELDNETFNRKYEKSHKQLIHLNRIPIRLVYMEEMDVKKKMDVPAVKDFVDGNKSPCEVLYGSTVELNIPSKLITSSNNDPNFEGIDINNAITRRLRILYLNSKFDEDLAEDNWETLEFKAVHDQHKIFEDDVVE